MSHRDTLFHLREWLTGHRETHTRHFGESDQSGHPHGYAGVVIPEWDLRQRLDEIQESLQRTPSRQDVEYLARIEYEAQMKSADVPAMPWVELSETHKEIAKAGIRVVLEALEGKDEA